MNTSTRNIPNPPLMPKDPYLRGRGRVLVDYALNFAHEPYWALRGEMLSPKRRATRRSSKKNGKAWRTCFSIWKPLWVTNFIFSAI